MQKMTRHPGLNVPLSTQRSPSLSHVQLQQASSVAKIIETGGGHRAADGDTRMQETDEIQLETTASTSVISCAANDDGLLLSDTSWYGTSLQYFARMRSRRRE